MTIIRILLAIIAFPFKAVVGGINYYRDHEAIDLMNNIRANDYAEAHPEKYNWKRYTFQIIGGIICFIIAIILLVN